MHIIKFFKENSKILTSFIVYQLGIDIFAAIVSFSSMKISQNLFLGSGIFCIFFYLFLVFTAANDEGARDSIRISSGRLSPMPLKGLWLGLAANSLNILLGIIVVITHYAGGKDIADAFKIITYFVQFIYGAVLTALEVNANPYFYLLIPIPAILVSCIFYYIGMRGILIIPEKKRKN